MYDINNFGVLANDRKVRSEVPGSRKSVKCEIGS